MNRVDNVESVDLGSSQVGGDSGGLVGVLGVDELARGGLGSSGALASLEGNSVVTTEIFVSKQNSIRGFICCLRSGSGSGSTIRVPALRRSNSVLRINEVLEALSRVLLLNGNDTVLEKNSHLA